MANCEFVLNDGTSKILLNDGVSTLLMNDNTCGGAGTDFARATTSSLMDGSLGNFKMAAAMQALDCGIATK